MQVLSVFLVQDKKLNRELTEKTSIKRKNVIE